MVRCLVAFNCSSVLSHASNRTAACAAPVLSISARVNTAKSTSSWLTVSGLQFGVWDTSASTQVETSDSCATSSWTSSTTMQCYVTAAAYMEDTLLITVVGATGTLAQGFTFDGALLCACICRSAVSQLIPLSHLYSQHRSLRPLPKTRRLALDRGSQ